LTRDERRRALELAIAEANAVVAAASDLAATTVAHASLARAHAARAEDALHGAGQLSQSAQRAPTLDACHDGWRRVEAIVEGAEASARAAATSAELLEREGASLRVVRDASAAARRAAGFALAARKLVDERNHAYTFHTHGAFSFGEGWYLAAGAVLASLVIQIEPGPDERVAQAERFLRDAGLLLQVRPYRSRPRAMKQVTELVARAFRADAPSAQARLRAAFLGDAAIAPGVAAWVDRRLAGVAAPDAKKVLVWIRDGVHHPGRNSTDAEVLELAKRARRAGLVPLLIGDALRAERVPDGAVDLILFWKDPVFSGVDGRRAQLQFFEHLRRRHGVMGQVGVTTAGMDGPALLGLPTLYLTTLANVRMGQWVGAVPDYVELVRESGYLERVTQALCEWAAR
jgi:hypothetical protein